MTKILKNLVNGRWLKTKECVEIVNVLNGKLNYKVPDTSISEITPFIKSIQSVPKSGLHNPFKNPERYQMLGDICFRTAHALHNKNIKDKRENIYRRKSKNNWSSSKSLVWSVW